MPVKWITRLRSQLSSAGASHLCSVPGMESEAVTSVSARPARELVESLREQLGTDAVVLITPGPRSCAVVIASAPGYPARLADTRQPPHDEGHRKQHSAGDERLAYSVTEAAKALGLSRDMIYQQLRAGRLGSLKVGGRRIITRHHIDVFLTGGA